MFFFKLRHRVRHDRDGMRCSLVFEAYAGDAGSRRGVAQSRAHKLCTSTRMAITQFFTTMCSPGISSSSVPVIVFHVRLSHSRLLASQPLFHVFSFYLCSQRTGPRSSRKQQEEQLRSRDTHDTDTNTENVCLVDNHTLPTSDLDDVSSV